MNNVQWKDPRYSLATHMSEKNLISLISKTQFTAVLESEHDPFRIGTNPYFIIHHMKRGTATLFGFGCKYDHLIQKFKKKSLIVNSVTADQITVVKSLNLIYKATSCSLMFFNSISWRHYPPYRSQNFHIYFTIDKINCAYNFFSKYVYNAIKLDLYGSFDGFILRLYSTSLARGPIHRHN